MKILTIFLPLVSIGSAAFSCRNNKGKKVDWWVVYKLPDINSHENPLVQEGLGYLYMDEKSKGKWKMGETSVNNSETPMAQTLEQLYRKSRKKSYFYLFYNDAHPDKRASDSYRAHAKGVQLFDSKSGLWLIHSVPKFPHQSKYFYPGSGTKNGQTMLCVTLNTHESLEEIATQMLYYQPSIYASNLPAKLARKYPTMASVLGVGKKTKGQIKKSPFSRTIDLHSKEGILFRSFAKHRRWNKDLYANLVAPKLKTNILVETWLHGDRDLPAECHVRYKTCNVERVKPLDLEFITSKDHSKWVVSDSEDSPWVCVGDINRQTSQFSRGGGTLCLQNKNVWKGFRGAVGRVKCCGQRWDSKQATSSSGQLRGLMDKGKAIGASISKYIIKKILQ